MKLKEIHIKNWKCFIDKKIEFSDKINLLKWANGTGKSSLLEAIIFALFDKRPNGLDFESLRNNPEINGSAVLKFENNLSDYVIEREFGNSSSHKLYKDGVLISRTKSDNKSILTKIIPESVMAGLWGYNSLALSPVLKTDFLYELLDSDFAEPLTIKKHFQADRTFHQKRISSLEKIIHNQEVTQEEIDILNKEILGIENQLKEKSFINDKDIIKAKQCEVDYPKYETAKTELSKMEVFYSREDCVRLYKYNLPTKDKWNNYFASIQKELKLEKSKATKLHPLAQYPKYVIDKMISDSCKDNKCVFCNSENFKKFEIDYNLVDSNKITKLEKVLEDYNRFDFDKFIISMEYYKVKKQVDDLSYVDSITWKDILNSYNTETNQLYENLEIKKKLLENLKTDLGKITELLADKEAYNEAKECIQIVDEYIINAKEYYADSIKKLASKILNRANPRYSKLDIENGIYKVIVNNSDYSTQSKLAVQSLSMGEKTLVSLSLILAIRDLFFKDIPLIMDEAFSNLDADNLNAINSILEHEKSQWILVSHDERLVVETM